MIWCERKSMTYQEARVRMCDVCSPYSVEIRHSESVLQMIARCVLERFALGVFGWRHNFCWSQTLLRSVMLVAGFTQISYATKLAALEPITGSEKPCRLHVPATANTRSRLLRYPWDQFFEKLLFMFNLLSMG